MKDVNTHSYKNLIGRDIVTENDPNAPFKKPPKDPKDYAVYKSYYENIYDEITDGGSQGFIKLSINCEGKDAKLRPIRMRTQKSEHFGCSFVFACDHVIHQDPDNPEGVTFIPFSRGGNTGYYVCGTCRKLHDTYRLDFETIHAKCALCVLESVQEIIKRKPDRILDLRNER